MLKSLSFRDFLFFPFIQFHRIGRKAKAQGRFLEYYLFPVLVAMLVTFVLMRFFTSLIPGRFVHVHGVHIHHFVIGIGLQNLAFILLLCSRKVQESTVKKYIVALLFGSGSGLILDELEVFLKLDGSASAHHYYFGVVWGSLILMLCIIAPSCIAWLKEKYHGH